MKLKPGVSTTEFKLTVTVGVIALALDIAGQIDGEVAVGALTILSAVYTVMRKQLKIAHLASDKQPTDEAPTP